MNFIIICLFFLSFVSCRKNNEESHQLTNVPDQVLEGFEINHTEQGRLVWHLTSKKATVREKENNALAEEPVVVFYKEGAISSVLQSRFAQLNTKTSDIEAWDQVKINAKESGSILETSRVFYNSKLNKMYSNETVTLLQKDSKTVGTGMESNVDLTSIVIKNQRVEIFNHEK